MATNTVNFIKLFCLIALISACEQPKDVVELTFSAQSQNQDISCAQPFTLPKQNRQFFLKDLRFYLSDIMLINNDNERISVELNQNNPWQHKNTVLIDLASLDGHCNGSQNTNSHITGTIPRGEYHQLEFELGVPFLLNHNEPSFSKSPLNIGSMFWSWQLGYKFLRLDIIDENQQSWFFHLGSTACQSPSTIRAPSSCNKPNRVSIKLNDFSLERTHISFNLDTLLKNSALTLESKCMSQISDNNDCIHLFNNLGLDIETGLCADHCKQQTVFTHEN